MMLAVALFAIAAQIVKPACAAPSDSAALYSELRIHAAARFTHEWLLSPDLIRLVPGGAVGTARMTPRVVESKLECLKLVAFDGPSPHGNRILIGIVGSNIVDLAGTGGGELKILASLLDLRVNDSDAALRLGQYFAWLVDPNGADSVLVGNDARRGRFAAAVVHDTAIVRPWGSTGVRVSTLSRTSEPVPGWRQFSYAFEFGTDGRLLSWTMCEMRMGKSDSHRQPTSGIGHYAGARTC